MYDREMAQIALERTSPEFRVMVEATARTRGISACDVALEIALMASQEESKGALYALQKRMRQEQERERRPRLRVVV